MYNTDPYPARNKQNDFKKEAKPRVPPYTGLDKLLNLKKSHEDILEKEAAKAKKLAEGGGTVHIEEDPKQGTGMDDSTA